MTEIILYFSILNLCLLLYIYIGYPVLLIVLSKTCPGPAIKKEPIRPTVSLLISCYNEGAVIRKKIENALSLDYPKEKYEIIVISDASTDSTDKIVREYEAQGVRLIRQENRRGKTFGLNGAVQRAMGEIIIFSDANAIYQSDAIIQLVENFADPIVGYAVGEAKYVGVKNSDASISENTYWRYEIKIKQMESSIHSIVGGDGAIYAIRKGLYKPLKDTDINDFVNPLQIIVSGYRGIYEPLAVCFEEAAGEFKKEFLRKTRIVNRSFSGLLSVKNALNPFYTGIFSFQLISHKLLRWFTGLFLFSFIVSSLVLALANVNAFQVIFIFEIIFLAFAYLGYLLDGFAVSFKPFYYSFYFVLINIAAINGIIKSLRGSVQITWEHHRIIS